MLKSVNRISVLRFIGNDGLTFPPRSTSWIQIYRRCSGLNKKTTKESEKISKDMSFTTFLQARQEEARRSFFAKVRTSEDCKKLLMLCKEYGNVKTAYYNEQPGSHVVVIEMEEEKNLNDFLTKINKGPFYCGFGNQFLVFKNLNDFIKTAKSETAKCFVKVPAISSKKLLNMELSNCKEGSLNDLIVKCYKYLKISEFEIRKKFLMCRELEILISGFLPDVVAYPFGSSVSGFGITGSDLDIAILPNLNGLENDGFKFDFASFSIELVRRHLAVISNVIEHFTNWSSDIVFVKNARVPIVKFKNKLSDMDVDLSMYNAHGLAVSQMYYTLASFDWRVRALVIFIKLWTKKVGILSKVPGARLSSFSVSVLVIFFLQEIQMLPPLNVFPCKDIQYLLKNEELILESALNKAKKNCNNNNRTVEELCKMFFEFYKNFNFHKWGISIKHGTTISNVDKFPLYIENPIYEGVNVSANVRSYDIFDTQDLINDATDILNDDRVKDKIRRIFNLSIRSKGKVERAGGY